MWRPDGWVNNRSELEIGLKAGGIPLEALMDWRKTYEDGADAMLEAIRNRGHLRGISLMNMKDALGWANINPDSKWYSIPEDE